MSDSITMRYEWVLHVPTIEPLKIVILITGYLSFASALPVKQWCTYIPEGHGSSQDFLVVRKCFDKID
jgi:hypothetical protein